MSKADQFESIAIIGCGKLGGILVRRWTEEGLYQPQQVCATVRHQARADSLSQANSFVVSTDNAAAVADAKTVVLCVKPHVVPEVAVDLRSALNPQARVISVVAGVTTRQLEEMLGDQVPVVRAMPNTPAAVGEAMTALCAGAKANKDDIEHARALFDALGRTVVLDEHHFDAVTGLSASGPAFIYVILESLAEAGVKVGLPRDTATLLAAQTTLGAARTVLETGSHPALLKDEVTTPAGCTVDGLMELEEGKLRVTLIKAVVQATQRAGQLG